MISGRDNVKAENKRGTEMEGEAEALHTFRAVHLKYIFYLQNILHPGFCLIRFKLIKVNQRKKQHCLAKEAKTL